MIPTNHPNETTTQEVQMLQQRITTLEAENKLYAQTLDSISDMVLVKGPQSCIVYANKAFRDFYGMSQEQLRDMIDAPFNEPDYTQQYIKDDTHVFTTGATLNIPAEPVTRYDGVVRSFHSVKSAIRNAEGQVTHTVGISRDISEHQNASDEMLLFKALAEFAPLGVSYSDLQGKMLYANQAYQTLTGHGERIVEKTIFDLYTEDAAYLGAAAQQVAEQGFWQGQLTCLRADGHTFPVDISVFLLRDAQGQPVGFGAFARDISEQQAQQQRMKIFEALVENAPDAIGVSGSDGRITYANAAQRALYGYGEATIGLDWRTLYPDDVRSQMDAMGDEMFKHGFWRGVLEQQDKHGRRFPMQISAFMLRDTTGAPYAYASIIRDLTEQRQAEAERAAMQAQVIEAQQTALRELSTPLIPLADGVVAMPLIGSVDSSRAQLVIETLLTGVAEQKAHTTIIDITGVPVVDTQVASALLRAAQAVKLLGAKVVLTGIRPEVAQTLVGLGLDLSGITTRGTLQSGVAEALARR